jgi:hypothetical protein
MVKQSIQLTLIAAGLLLAGSKDVAATFSNPEAARDALLQAASTGLEAVAALFGPGSAEILRTGDAVQDKQVLDRFNQRAKEKTRLMTDEMNPDRVMLLVGEEEWPFAVPLKRENGRWHFDLEEGKTEIRHRIIGANELDAMQICRGYVEAQEIYAQTDWEGKGVPQFARKVFSTPGKKDGLYWPGEDSPVAAGFAKAVREGYAPPGEKPTGYHGYRYKILLKQGPSASGGAQDYIVRGLMIGGFALVAWPDHDFHCQPRRSGLRKGLRSANQPGGRSHDYLQSG